MKTESWENNININFFLQIYRDWELNELNIKKSMNKIEGVKYPPSFVPGRVAEMAKALLWDEKN